MTYKNDVLTYILKYFHQKSGCSATLHRPPTPSSAQFYCYYRPPVRREKSCQALVRCPGQRQSGFQSVFRSEAMESVGDAGSQSGPSKWTTGASPLWVSSQNWQPLQLGDKYTLHIFYTGILQLRPHRSHVIGPKVRSIFTSPGP